MKKISEEVKEGKILISDGAWGTFLYEKGLKPGECPELWNISRRSDVLDIARKYVDAGADMIETNSFGGNSFKLSQFNLSAMGYDINKAAAEISREAAGPDRHVLGSIGPTGRFLMMGDVTEDDLYETFKHQAMALEEGGADACCIETFYDINEALYAINAVKENTKLEIICSFTFDKNPSGEYRTMMGASPADVLTSALEAGADIIGTNCGSGLEGMNDIIKEYRTINSIVPIIVQANAGLPIIHENQVIYPESPQIMADFLREIINSGANIIGGCCGTTPEHIKLFSQYVRKSISA